MNKVLALLSIGFFLVLSVYGQDSTLQEYKGKYKITSGRVSEVEITGDSASLTINSAMGSATLVRGEGDVFNMVEFSGTVEFIRNADKKVAGIRISVMGIELEGTKESTALRAHGLRIRPLAVRSFPAYVRSEGSPTTELQILDAAP